MNLQELLAKIENIAELSHEEISQLKTDLVALFDQIVQGEAIGENGEKIQQNDLEVLGAIKEGLDTVNARADILETEAAETEAKIAELSNAIHGEDPEPEPEENPDDGTAKVEDEETPDVEIVETETEEKVTTTEEGGEDNQENKQEDEVAPVRSLQPALAAAAKRVPTIRTRERDEVTASDDAVYELANGKKVGNVGMALAMQDAYESFGNTLGGVTQKVRVGRQTINPPEDRWLHKDQDHENEKKIEAVVAGADRPEAWTDAIVAAGGFCSMLENDYSVQGISGEHRPVRDSLPRFVADRGGIRFKRPLAFTSASGAVDIWTEAIDTTPGAETKNRLTLTCQSTIEVVTEAITARVLIGNFEARANPEVVADTLQAVRAYHARVSENELLRQLAASATAVTTTQVVGVARDLLVRVAEAAAAYRSSWRLLPDARLRIQLPQWVPDLIGADLTRGQQSDPDFLNVGKAEVTRWLSTRNLNVSWYSDTAPASAGTPDSMIADTIVAGNLIGFPGHVRAFIYLEGQYTFLDGGNLDVGVVRDSTMNATNDYEIFSETWEGLAFRGNQALDLNIPICLAGTAAGTEDTSAQCGS